jgi:hypothetical protein
MMRAADPLNRRPAAADRRRWDDLHAAQATARAAYDALDTKLSLKYGLNYQRMWVAKGERDQLERLRVRENKVGDKIIELLVRISPRGHAWLSGAPSHWIRYELTWEDAVRPAGEPLSVTSARTVRDEPRADGDDRRRQYPLGRRAASWPARIWGGGTPRS